MRGQAAPSSPPGALAEGGNQALAANVRDGKFDLSAFGGCQQFLLEISQAAFFVLTDQFADVFAGRAQSPEATCPSTYSFSASGREMFNEVIAMAS